MPASPARDEHDDLAVRIHRAYYTGEDAGFDGDWVSELFPHGLPVWADLVLVRAIAGNLLCRMQCVRCEATGSPVHPEDHRPGCDHVTFAADGPR